ncbi:MAG: helix-turn-helix transcriptional regulator [Lachnospiraceae bacterium]|nr:helix-turn-helix transcriptional regulator [Lachnospiraceae bacterium]
MDLVRVGKFIAELRKEQELTQEQLGEKIGVTNKTVSRWENGNYLPPADVLLTMSQLFDVSVNEILSGKRLLAEEYKEAAEINLAHTLKVSSFSLKERIDFYKTKWLKEHISIMVFIGICIIGVALLGIVCKQGWIIFMAILFLLVAHGWRNNTMMTYIENNAYDGSGAR